MHVNNPNDFPLRERKKARTRLSILDAVIQRLYSHPLADITIDMICGDVQISKGTFFQYFPQKSDVLVLYGLLWNLEAMWYAARSGRVTPGLEAIEHIFRELGRKVEEHPRLWMEIIALRAYKPKEFALMGGTDTDQVSTVERYLRFPDFEGIESVKEGNFRQLFLLNLKAAAANGELPEKTDLETCYMSLACFFYGVPLMSFGIEPVQCTDAYLKQIHLLWKSLGARI
jgi:AcrR family transcriptional regulator